MKVPAKELAADASFLINLIATQTASELAELAGYSLLVPAAVYAEVKRDRAQLESLVRRGVAKRVELEGSALRHYVAASAVVDDGEAAAIAVGLALGINVATDDGCASDYWLENAGHLGLQALGICDLLQSLEHQLEPKKLREMLIRVRRDANFEPPSTHVKWWRRLTST